jgi:hypothetical protein
MHSVKNYNSLLEQAHTQGHTCMEGEHHSVNLTEDVKIDFSKMENCRKNTLKCTFEKTLWMLCLVKSSLT